MKKYIKSSYDKQLIDLQAEIKDSLIGITANTIKDLYTEIMIRLEEIPNVYHIRISTDLNRDEVDIVWVIVDYEVDTQLEFCVVIQYRNSIHTYIIDDVGFDV